MFTFEAHYQRCAWRPDLVPSILKWVESLPEAAWRDFRGFSIEAHGAFGADFDVRPERGGPKRRISHRFDHTYHDIENDAGIWHVPAGPTSFHISQLTEAANRSDG